MRRSAFSTMMTAPSTIRPKSSSPRLIRLAETPPRNMPKLVIAMVIGITSAAISAARKLPSRSEEHTSELQSLMRISYAVFCLKKQKHHGAVIHKQETTSTKSSHKNKEDTADKPYR